MSSRKVRAMRAALGRRYGLRRLVAYMLSHCGLGLTSVVVGAVVGTTR
jgi:hypothetical protein